MPQLAFCLLLAALNASPLLVSTDGLGSTSNLQIVDARAAETYAAGHIPGAIHCDSADLAEERGGVVGLLKPLDTCKEVLAAAGVDPRKRVVIYSEMGASGDLKSATRLFWILELLGYGDVAILDGGLAKWKAENRPVETKGVTPPPLSPVELPDTPRDALLASKQGVLHLMKSGQGVLLDLRPPEEYAGLSKKPFLKTPGNIPGAVNFPAGECVAESKTFKDLDTLSKNLESVAPDKKAPIITYCNTGRDATVGYFALRLAGYGNVAVYDGSMAEWNPQDARSVSN